MAPRTSRDLSAPCVLPLRTAYALTATIALLATLVVGFRASPAEAGTTRPNVLLIVADDQTTSMFTRPLMPTVFGELVDKGTRFDRHYVSSALCCPSRAEILTGLNERHTGVDGNDRQLSVPTIAAALRGAGYRTAMAGKYLNSWPCGKKRAEYDLWVCQGNGQSSYSSSDPTLNVNGSWQKFSGVAPQIIAEKVSGFIKSTPADQPFFAMYSPTTPHSPSDDPRYSTLPVVPHRPPSYDEDTPNTGKPRYLHNPAMPPVVTAGIDRDHAAMVRSTRALDDSVKTLLSSLGSRASNTLVVYVSDNGFLLGEHRTLGKGHAYEESVRTPLVVRAPGGIAGQASTALVQNLDITPTIAQLAGIPWRADGTSFASILSGEQSSVRDHALIEHCAGPSYPCGVPYLKYGVWGYAPPSYQGVVEDRYKFVRYVTGEEELYDLWVDPHELTNLAADADWAEERARLSSRLRSLTARTAPDTTIVAVTGGQGETRTFKLTYFARATTQQFRCRLIRHSTPGPWVACPPTGWVVGPLPEGFYEIDVAAVDSTGTVDPVPARYVLAIHDSGPQVTISSAPTARSKSRTARFAFSSQTAGVRYQCRLGSTTAMGSWAGCSSGITYSNLADGGYLFSVRAIDAKGVKTTPPAERAFQVDNTGPLAVFDSQPGRFTTSGSADVRFHFAEKVAGAVTCSLDGGVKTGCATGRFTASSLPAGAHTLAVTTTDTLGNTATTRLTWTIDRTAPVVTIRAPTGTATSRTVQALFSANEETDYFLCSTDFAPAVECDPESMVMFVLADGRHSLRVWATDLADNVSAPATTTWSVSAPG